MQSLECATCDSSPLESPRLSGGAWYALCPGCGESNMLEADITNIFLPVRFRVVGAGPARRARESCDGGTHAANPGRAGSTPRFN